MPTKPTFVQDTLQHLSDKSRRAGGKSTTTFADNMKLPVHRWYRYSAGYSATWARDLAQFWQSTSVLDPFGGSGTTVLAAQEVGIPATGAEIHPTVARIANAKLDWGKDSEGYMDAIEEVISRAREITEIVHPNAPLFVKCFPDKESADALISIRDAVLQVKGEYEDLIWLTFVSIIRACSPAGTAQWQYVLPNNRKSRVVEPFEAFKAAAESFADDMKMRQFLVQDPVSAKVLLTDARSLVGIEDKGFDTVITSPPYANNYDYADTLRLELIVLGEIEGWKDLRPLREQLLLSATQNIGSRSDDEALDSMLMAPIMNEFLPVYKELDEVRRTRGGNKKYHSMLSGYFYDNAQVFSALREKLVSGSKVCYVVGDSAPYGVHAPVEKWLGELALNAGFNAWEFTKVRDRNTKWKNRKHRHPLHEGYLWIEG